MQVSIASGKGGTGKTMVAVNLAAAIAHHHLSPVFFLDCDVEAPNAALFLHPQFDTSLDVVDLVPHINETKCTLCELCARNCQFNALVVSKSKILFFPELCHACGGCALICPEQAITEVPAHTGIIRKGTFDSIPFFQGELDIGRPSPVGIIKKMFQIQEQELINKASLPVTIVDSPPGVSCPVVASLQGADFVILVTEPTPFGLHDLHMAVQLVRDEMHLPLGIIINKHDCGTQDVENYCQSAHLPILQRIPFSRHIAEIYANGQMLIDAEPSFEKDFIQTWKNILALGIATQNEEEG